MSSTTLPLSANKPQIDWMNVVFIAGMHVLAAVGVVLVVMGKVHWQTLVLAVVLNLLCSISITGGYHRLFAHVSYSASWPVRLFYLLFGAASVQNTALKWSSLHRRHHTHCDSAADPYNARRGFWWSHIGWIFFVGKDDFSNVPDLKEDPLVLWQVRWYLPLVGLLAFGLPIGLSALWGDVWGGVFVAASLRLVVQYHSTFAINSFAHLLGEKHYSTEGTPKDSWITAMLTLGEGYHDFHHRFPADYRNGVRPADFDPTKWWVWTLARVGMARDLRRISDERIAEARSSSAARRGR